MQSVAHRAFPEAAALNTAGLKRGRADALRYYVPERGPSVTRAFRNAGLQ
jgi:hypothetical protein